MEQRKIIKLGESSLVVSLPKEWIEKFNIKKGDTVDFEISEEGSLIIIPKLILGPAEREVEIIASSDFTPGRLERELIAAYLGNYSTIRVKAEENFTKEQQLEIRSRVKRLTGCQIIESSSSEIVIQNLLRVDELSVDKGIYRAYLITLSMLKDCITSIQELKPELLDNLPQIDDDVDQFYFLILKQLRSGLLDYRTLFKLKLKPIDCLDYFMVMQRIEHIADHINRIADQLKLLFSSSPHCDNILKELLELLTTVYTIFEGAMDSFLIGNIDIANKIINDNMSFKNKREAFKKWFENNKLPPDILVALNFTVDSIFRISDYATDIAEVAINRVI
ncbi:MAG: phosphate uptake regulator PhoU [Candidatus Odinarchaeum yellowstonii]|uniref:Phosphate uptake regulator PhoU n=1 Tax=Odinarchaeota yellowstonii (strain LCB_4) TaxID=1841599 RepID=A0AAF0D1G6_ODILC|nr:MAG: phosphate uptake regulator PhoU [Candidatus Odinarchaeum yellowstonii]